MLSESVCADGCGFVCVYVCVCIRVRQIHVGGKVNTLDWRHDFILLLLEGACFPFSAIHLFLFLTSLRLLICEIY